MMPDRMTLLFIGILMITSECSFARSVGVLRLSALPPPPKNFQDIIEYDKGTSYDLLLDGYLHFVSRRTLFP